MFYTGGLGLDTEMLSFLMRKDKTGKNIITFKLKEAINGTKESGLLVSMGKIEDEFYMSRFWPVSQTIKSRSNHNLILHFSDGSTVLCDRLQKFMMSNRKWKEANLLTPEDSFFQICRNYRLTECYGDYRDDTKEFWFDYTEGTKPIKLTETEKLPGTRTDYLGIAVDFFRDNVVLGNGLLAEGLCLNIKEDDTDWY